MMSTACWDPAVCPQAFDEDNSGFISREELEHALKKGSSKFSNQELQQDIAKVLLECDQDKDGRIDYAGES
jgi:calcium-dependent protein kinase